MNVKKCFKAFVRLITSHKIGAAVTLLATLLASGFTIWDRFSSTEHIEPSAASIRVGKIVANGNNSPVSISIASHADPKAIAVAVLEGMKADLLRDEEQIFARIGAYIDKGDIQSALIDAADAERHFTANQQNLARLYYIESQLLLLANDPTVATDRSLLATTMVPKNCTYRSINAFLLVSQGRWAEAYNAVRTGVPTVDDCIENGAMTDAAMIRFVRVNVAANDRNEALAKKEMSELNHILVNISRQPSSGNAYYAVVLNCMFSRIGFSWWPDEAKKNWPNAEVRCVESGRAQEKAANGASVFASFIGTNWDPIAHDTDRWDRVARLSEQIDQWSTTPSIPMMGIDDYQRQILIGALYLERGFARLWTKHDPNGAKNDYTIAYRLLQPSGAVTRPEAMVSFANLAFKIRHLEQLSNAPVIDDSTTAFSEWLVSVATSDFEGLTPNNCEALSSVAGLAYELKSTQIEILDRKLDSCRRVFVHGTVSDLVFRSYLFERRAHYFQSIGDVAKLRQAVDAAIEARTQMEGFPFQEYHSSALASDLLGRAYINAESHDISSAIHDTERAIDAATRAHDNRLLVKSLMLNGFLEALSSGNGTLGQQRVNRAKQLSKAAYEDPSNKLYSCGDLYLYGETFQFDVRLSIMREDWQKAADKAASFQKTLTDGMVACGDLSFDNSSSKSASMNNALLSQLMDVGLTLPIMKVLINDESEARGRFDDLLMQTKEYLPTERALGLLAPITYQMKITLNKDAEFLRARK